MATKLFDLQRNVSINPGVGGLTFNPLLREVINGVETPVPPDIVIPVPKATGASAAVTSAMAVGNLVIDHNEPGPAATLFDVLSIRLHPIQRVAAAVFGASQDLRRYFTILDAGPDATHGAIYQDDDDPTRQFRVEITKVSGDGSTLLRTTQIAGTSIPTIGGADTLSLVSGTGDATIAYTGISFEKYSNIQNAQAIGPNGTGGTDIFPNLAANNALVAPQIVIPIAKTVPTLATTQPFVVTAMGTGAINIRNSEAAGNVNHDILSILFHSLQNLTAALFGTVLDQRRYFTISNAGPDATHGAVYSDDDDPTRQFRVEITKVSNDGSTLLTTTQIAGTTAPTVGGADNLSLVSGTGDADIAYTNVRFEKLVHVENARSVPNGGGFPFDPGLVENGVPVMPDIVIPIPKAINCVPYVPTDLTGAVGSVTVQHQAGAPVNCDILYLRACSIFRDV